MNGIGNDDRAHIPPATAPARAPWSAYILHDITIGKSARNHTDHMNHAKSNHADGAVRRSSGCAPRGTPSMCIPYMKTRSPRLSLLTSSSDEPDT